MRIRRFVAPLAALSVLSTFSGGLLAQSLPAQAQAQIAALWQEKLTWTAAQQKVDSNIHYAAKMANGQAITQQYPTMPAAYSSLQMDSGGRALVDIQTNGGQAVLNDITARGGTVVNSNPQSIRAWMPVTQIEGLAGRNDVQFIGRAATRTLNSSFRLGGMGKLPLAQRMANVRAQLNAALPLLAARKGLGLPSLGLSFFTRPVSEGDVAHGANLARSVYGIAGAGVKIGVMSDSASAASIAALQSTGDLPAAGVTVVPGQDGTPGTDEGTAMLEIVYDLAPGAQLFFATADPNVAQFATNIQTLRTTYNCDIIVDDVTYFNEGAFQDGPIAQAVNTVVASGAMYFSSAANSGNFDSGNSGTWEGDYVDSGVQLTGVPKGTEQIHLFPGNNISDPLRVGTDFITLKWSDPLGASNNDYDLFVFDSSFNFITGSTNIQNGTQDPFEIVGGFFIPAGSQIVVAQFNAAPRALRIDTNRGRLAIGTTGSTFGHNGGASTVTVAATSAFGKNSLFVGPGTFVETYSSDGPRKIFYQPNGTPITPGNFLFGTNGGTTLNKPDLTAADCVSSHVPGFSPFCGTSAAAPHAAAMAALLKSANPAASGPAIIAALKNTALDIQAVGFDRDSGAGIVLARNATQGIVLPPTVSKAFLTSPIPLGGTTSLSLSVANPNTTITLTGVNLTDPFPQGMVGILAAGAICAGTFNITATSVTFSGLTIPPSGSCTVIFPVQANKAGTLTNTTSTATSNQALPGAAATATLSVTAPPVITIAFSPSSVAPGGMTTLTFTITNPNPTTTLTGIGFTDTLTPLTNPTGLVGTCNGTAPTTTATTISLAGATLPGGASCTFSITVTDPVMGAVTNSTGSVTSTNGGTGTAGTASLNARSGAVAVDSQGHILVALPNANKVLTFNSNGSPLSSLNPSFLGAFGQPSGIAVDSKDNIYVADTGNNRVLVFASIAKGAAPQLQTTTGNFAPLSSPKGVALDSSDNLLVSDTANNRVVAFAVTHSASGGVSGLSSLTQIGPSISFLGQLNAPADIAIDSQNNILVLDSGNNRVVTFTSLAQGHAPHTQIGPAIGFLGQLATPGGLAVNSKDPNSTGKDEILIADTGNNRVVVLTSVAQGASPRNQIISSGINGQLTNIAGGLGTAPNGNILLLEPSSSRLAEFSDTGTFSFSVPITF